MAAEIWKQERREFPGVARSPRYVEIADDLRRRIRRGRIPVGGQLPTEFELCAANGVSRHTARAALRLLEDEGLIARRPGLGTTVIAAREPGAFTQTLGGLEDLLQYAHAARLETHACAPRSLSAEEARRLGARRGSAWLVLDGLRVAGGRAIAATSIYVADAIGAKPRDFRDASLAVTEHVEAKYGVAVALIRQTIKAERIAAEDAAAIGAGADLPVLRTIRRYYDAAERLFVISDTRHPADRFVYEMSFRRTAPNRD